MNSRSVLASTSAMAVLGIALAGCGGSSGGGAAKTQQTPAANLNSQASKTEIAALFKRFFDEPQPQAVSDLEDGSTMGKAIKIAAKLKGNKSESATVKSVSISTTTKPPTATVDYSLQSGGSTALPDATGYAVYENGKWLFARKTFCQLVSLGVSKPVPGCANA